MWPVILYFVFILFFVLPFTSSKLNKELFCMKTLVKIIHKPCLHVISTTWELSLIHISYHKSDIRIFVLSQPHLDFQFVRIFEVYFKLLKLYAGKHYNPYFILFLINEVLKLNH